MPRRAVGSHRRRDKINNQVVPEARGEAQLADFLGVKAGQKKKPRADLIQEILLKWANKQGFKGDERTALGVFLRTQAAAMKLTRSALAEQILKGWAQRSGFTAEK